MPVGQHQRRPGVHIERPGALSARLVHRPTCESYDDYWKSEYAPLAWGLGGYGLRSIPVDGIYMASNQDDTTSVYPYLVKDPENVTDHHGGCEHFRKHLGVGVNMKKNCLYWIFDRTPHESLPVKARFNLMVQSGHLRHAYQALS